MRRNSPRADWFFPIEEAPVLVTVTHKGVAGPSQVPHKKALIAADTGDIVGIHSLKVARPFAGMAALSEEFRKTLAGVRSVGMTLFFHPNCK